MSTLVKAWCTCGWHGEYDTTPRAEFARRKHSCAKHEAARARKVRGVERRRAVEASRVERPCEHTHTHHDHGTHTAYVLDACRCRPCTDAQYAYNVDRNRRNAYGRSNLVAADAARAHVDQLAAAGMGLKTLSARSGVSHGSLWKLMYGKTKADGSRTPSRRIARDTAAAILAVRPTVDALADGALVPAAGCRRRLRSLVSIGWSASRLAERAGVDRQILDALITGRRDTATAVSVRSIRALYDDLWSTRPPEGDHRAKIAASRSRRRAEVAGWPMPLDLDEDTVDDPDAPEPARAADMPWRRADLDEWAHLVRSGSNPQEAARRIGLAPSGLDTTVRRSRPDLLPLLTRSAA